jgi:hypothetical protein
LRFRAALRQCARLVQARHHNRQFRPHNFTVSLCLLHQY